MFRYVTFPGKVSKEKIKGMGFWHQKSFGYKNFIYILSMKLD